MMARVRVHHLSCATICHPGGRFWDGRAGVLRTARLVCHCLLLEAEDGLVLVDTGLGTADLAHPRRRLGPLWLAYSRPLLDPGQTALAQVRRLGFAAVDVRHIVLTHLDLDHAGGLSDFPSAQVHVLDVEHAAAMQPPTTKEKRRYRQQQWEHQPRWVIHGGRGEQWMGFDAVAAINDVLLVPLHGHTRGHAGVAVRVGEQWLLHCGDAYYFHAEIDPEPSCPRGLGAFQRLVAVDDRARRHNQARLRELRLSHGPEIRLVCAHDPLELRQATASVPAV
ncbi:MAG TPA: MBL fold metallo-hydrolase [Solirubrobacteraceae bacterium]|nr:MBL fold metallo-hydrolase [Solirubrobacteraceae bacterium]